MTPAGLAAAIGSDGDDTAGTSFAEDVLDALVPLLHPHQAEDEVHGEVAYDVGRVLVLDDDLALAAPRRPGGQPGVDQRLAEHPLRVRPALDLHDEAAG